MTATITQSWNAQDYARNSSAQAKWALELIEKLPLRGDETLLDIGCGDGKITAVLAERLPRGRAVGIDASAAMVTLAQERFPTTETPNLSFRAMDATVLDLPERFDAVFSNATLHWIADHRAVLRGLSRCLNPSARILFQMGGRGNTLGIEAAFRSRMEDPRWQEYFIGFQKPHHYYGPEEYQQWLPEAGFRPRRVELIPKDMQHEDPDGLKGWLRTTWFPYTNRVPETQRDAFLSEVLDAYLVVNPLDEQGKTHVAMVRLEVEAEFVGEN